MYDSKSFELAEHFLSDEAASEETKAELARAIQSAVETWFFGRTMKPVEPEFQEALYGNRSELYTLL